MPKIPTYTSNQRLTSETPSVQQSLEISGMPGKQIAQVGETVANVSSQYADKFKKADQLRQKTDAEVKYHEDYGALAEEVLNDNESDFETLDKKTRAGLEKIRSEASIKVKDRDAKLVFDSESQLMNVKAYSDIRNKLRKKQVAKGAATLDNRVTQLENAYNQTGDAGYLTQIGQTMNEYQKAGYITPKEAQKKIKEINKGVLFSDFNKDPDKAIGMLESASGAASGLDPEERADIKGKLLKLKEKKSKEARQEMALIEDDTEREVALKLTKDQVNQSDLDSLLTGTRDEKGQIRRISRSYYESASKAILEPYNDPDVSLPDKLSKYSELIGEYTKLKRSDAFRNTALEKKYGGPHGNPIESIQSFRQKVLDSTRYLTREQAEQFFEATQGNLNDALNPKANAIEMINNYASNWVGRDPLVAIASRFFNETKGKDLSPAQTMEKAKQIVEEDKKVRNPNRAKYELGQVINTPKGAVKVTGFDDDGEPIVERAKS